MLGLAMIVAAALAPDPIASLELRGQTGCPTADAVRSQLQPLAPRAWPADAPIKWVALAEVQDRPTERGALIVTLVGQGEVLLEERRLTLYPTCEERARAVAVVIASWMTALPAGAPLTARLLLPPPPVPAVTRPAPAAAPSRALLIRPAVGALASVATDGVAPGVLAEVALTAPGARWSVDLTGLLEGHHRLAVGAGHATWWRWGGAAGGAWQLVRGRTWLDLRAAFLVTRLHLVGEGFLNNFGGTTWDLGGAVGTRLGYSWARVQPWLGAWAVGWGGSQDVHLIGDATRGAIPRWEALAGVGATFGTTSAMF